MFKEQNVQYYYHTRVTLYLFYRITLKNKFTKYCQGHTAWIRGMWRHRFSRSRVVCSAVRFKTFASRDEYIFDIHVGKNIFVLRNKYSFLCMSGDTIREGISPQLWKVRGQGRDNVKGVEGPTQRTSTATESLSERKEIGVACFFRKI